MRRSPAPNHTRLGRAAIPVRSRRTSFRRFPRADRLRNTWRAADTGEFREADLPPALDALADTQVQAHPSLRLKLSEITESFQRVPRSGYTHSRTNPHIHRWAPRGRFEARRVLADPPAAWDAHVRAQPLRLGRESRTQCRILRESAHAITP